MRQRPRLSWSKSHFFRDRLFVTVLIIGPLCFLAFANIRIVANVSPVNFCLGFLLYSFCCMFIDVVCYKRMPLRLVPRFVQWASYPTGLSWLLLYLELLLLAPLYSFLASVPYTESLLVAQLTSLIIAHLMIGHRIGVWRQFRGRAISGPFPYKK